MQNKLDYLIEELIKEDSNIYNIEIPTTIYEKVHIMMGLIDNLCHEIIYHKHDDMNYDIMTNLVIENIKNLFKSDLN